jgi:hypothetical protein
MGHVRLGNESEGLGRGRQSGGRDGSLDLFSTGAEQKDVLDGRASCRNAMGQMLKTVVRIRGPRI